MVRGFSAFTGRSARSPLRELDELGGLAQPAPGAGVHVVLGGDQAGGGVRDVHGVIAEHQAGRRLAGEPGTVVVIRGRLSRPEGLAGP
ncbi:hypothetical protein Sros01_83910 [Streptomyces roseochromogenus]|nr:hypothetical protein Sros01_83910 [Streptomyces roseochromogenus]